jgi:hypothetical protein
MNEAMRYKLRMMGIEVVGPMNAFCDNQSVVTNAGTPQSTLSKKHNAIAYHKTRESVAAETIRIAHEKGRHNLSDVLTKFLPGPAFKKCVQCILTRLWTIHMVHELRGLCKSCEGMCHWAIVLGSRQKEEGAVRE